MIFQCKKCGARVTVPPTVKEGVVACPGCGARYRLRPRKTRPEPPSSPAPTEAQLAASPVSSQDPGATTPLSTSKLAPPDPTTDGATDRTGQIPRPATPEPPLAARPTFAEGDLVAGRYRVVRFIAQGGMGEVYEAHDQELRESVALKTLRPRASQDEHAIERLKREIQLARKVTHPNVCRIFDVGFHRVEVPPDGRSSGTEVTFFTMEYLRGETLAQRIRWRGRMSTEESLPIVRQIAAGLNAAHEAGIVHRDFKPDNVILVPTEHGDRAVITDFGVARGRRELDRFSDATMAGDGAIVGTPAYMAPEQVADEEITPRTDIYALGIVMYEMLTGNCPFVGSSPMTTAVKRLSEQPQPPRQLVPDLEQSWETAILRCLQRQPGHRFASVADVVTALEPKPVPRPVVATPPPQPPDLEQQIELQRQRTRKRRRQRLQLALLAVLPVVAGTSTYIRLQKRLSIGSGAADILPSGPIVARRSVAVVGFQNTSRRPEVAWVATALGEMLTTELAAGGELRLIPGENVARMRVELGLNELEALAADTLAQIRSHLGTDFVVLGSYVLLGRDLEAKIRLDLRLQDAVAGETLASFQEMGEEEEMFDVVTRAGERLRRELGVGAARAGTRNAARKAMPQDSRAARLYAEGLEGLRRYQPLEARQFLLEAATIAPDSAMVHSALASALSALGYESEAASEAEKAFDLSQGLPEQDRLAVEGRYRETTQEWRRAAEIYSALWRRFPDNLEYGLRLAACQTSAGAGHDALATVTALRTLPEPARHDPRIGLEEASAAGMMADYRRQQAAAAAAAQHAEALGAQMLVAQARLSEGWAFRNLGEPAKAKAACEEARKLYSQAGNSPGLAFALTTMAGVLFDEGDLEAARRRSEEALEIYQQIGDKGGEARALNNVALVLKRQGDLSGARRLYQEVLQISRQIEDQRAMATAHHNIAGVLYEQGDLGGARRRFEECLKIRQATGDRSGEASALSNLAVVLRKQGDLAGAGEMLESSLRILQESGQKVGEVSALNNLGRLLFDRGDLNEAERVLQRCLTTSREIGNRSAMAEALFSLGEVREAQGNLVAARRDQEQALEIRRDLGEKGKVTESRLALAGLLLEEGRPDLAAAEARTAAAEFRGVQAVANEARARAFLARALLAQGQISEGQREVDRATLLSYESDDRRSRLLVRIISARFLAQGGGEGEAVENLRDAAEEAARAGLVGMELEARLALAETELAAGRVADGLAELDALENDARLKRFGLLADRAERLRVAEQRR